uniref:SCP domain-containing protein n=1 Tax=Bursaphelenchus xylophilus TaxID=6326 RepID=A0A1I7SES1_BURXY
MAQNHANTCVFLHSIEHRRPKLGENICRYVIEQPVVPHEAIVKDCIARWYNTSINFDPEKLKFNVRHYIGNVNDFTAMIWGAATAVGCGLRQCDDQVFFVCNYGPSSVSFRNGYQSVGKIVAGSGVLESPIIALRRSNVLDEPIFEPGLPCRAAIECTTFGRSQCENSTGLCVSY